MRLETNVCRKLISGNVLCSVTDYEAVDWLRGSVAKEVVNDALGYYGFSLSSDEDEDYFYASYDDLDDREDSKALKSRLQVIVDAMHPIFRFMEFVSQANNEDVYPDIGHIYRLSELLITIENNDSVAESLKGLTSTKFFKNSRSKTSINERLSSILSIMTDEGLLFSDGSGVKFTVTGKFAYYIQVYLSVIAMQAPEILDDSQDEQSVMELDL